MYVALWFSLLLMLSEGHTLALLNPMDFLYRSFYSSQAADLNTIKKHHVIKTTDICSKTRPLH